MQAARLVSWGCDLLTNNNSPRLSTCVDLTNLRAFVVFFGVVFFSLFTWLQFTCFPLFLFLLPTMILLLSSLYNIILIFVWILHFLSFAWILVFSFFHVLFFCLFFCLSFNWFFLSFFRFYFLFFIYWFSNFTSRFLFCFS